jgi:hypothetical protein
MRQTATIDRSLHRYVLTRNMAVITAEAELVVNLMIVANVISKRQLNVTKYAS